MISSARQPRKTAIVCIVLGVSWSLLTTSLGFLMSGIGFVIVVVVLLYSLLEFMFGTVRVAYFPRLMNSWILENYTATFLNKHNA